ncbi:trigger factor [Companilactobacillus pabuli]|uniref:Trigger factor n=1 Tax=Companilactobacillus pabuli TaxID=2714036 RepID=A0A7L7KWL0_9LACO|nr:trigger factor [Companilactobacillus pabuli]AKP04072.1 trigger factor [Companilactobacillus farciminis]AKS52377.1 trigger factor [Companilactobacillus farciminis]MDG5113341.1 trigger factor [Companilactobacillus pabuli]QMT83859.1 trigger factor [Companilactobacillus pabuli]GAQ02389.1 trigger factor [Companilactobacillus farciminis]
MSAKAKFTKKENNTGELKFEIDQDTIKQGLDTAFNRVKKSLNVPGFRKGRVPRQIFNRMYGEEALYEDALNAVLPAAYQSAVDETKVEPVDQPQINVESMEKGKPWAITAVITVKPDVELGDYKGIQVKKQKRNVMKADVEARLEELQKQQAELVLKDGKAEKGDTVIIDYVGTVDGKEFDGGSAQNYSLELGSGTFIPGFEDELIGHSAGEDVDVNVTFPEDYQAKDLAGKKAIFKTKLHEVKTKELPELDDDFAKDVDENVDTLEELKTKVHDEIKDQKKETAEENIQEEAISGAVKNAKIDDIPQAMIDTEVENQLNQYLANLRRQGIDPKLYYQMTGTSEDDLKKQFAKDAEERVKTDLVIEAIVAKEDIKPSEDEIKAEIKSLADEYKMEEKAVRNALSDDMLAHDIAAKKAIELIVDSAVEK